MLDTYYAQLADEIAGLVVVSTFGFYALRLLANFRQGMLEKGWKQVAAGALALISAQFLFLVSLMGSSGWAGALNDIGEAMRFIAMIFLILGLRAHYLVWRVDKRVIAPVERSN